MEEGRTMSALTLMIIRHGDKPARGWPGPGDTFEGEEDDKSLVIRGWERAGAWCALFGGGRGGADFPQPTAIYAANPDGTSADPSLVSKRPLETVTPLAEKLGPSVPLNTKHGVGQEAKLVAKIIDLSGVVLVCWEHKRIISGIIPAIPGTAGLPVPSRWDGLRFDVVLRFDRASNGTWAFRQLFPLLLSGDSDNPVETKLSKD
jgi:hypothetical protein